MRPASMLPTQPLAPIRLRMLNVNNTKYASLSPDKNVSYSVSNYETEFFFNPPWVLLDSSPNSAQSWFYVTSGLELNVLAIPQYQKPPNISSILPRMILSILRATFSDSGIGGLMTQRFFACLFPFALYPCCECYPAPGLVAFLSSAGCAGPTGCRLVYFRLVRTGVTSGAG